MQSGRPLAVPRPDRRPRSCCRRRCHRRHKPQGQASARRRPCPTARVRPAAR